MQFFGGVGQGLLEPVGWRLGLLRAGAVIHRGGAQQVSAERGAGAEPDRVQGRGHYRPPVRAGGLGVLPVGDQLRRGRQRLGQPVPARLQRGPQLQIPVRDSVGPAPLRRAEHRRDADHGGQAQNLAFPRVRIRGAGDTHRSPGAVQVRPQRADDHHRARGVEQRPHHAAGQPVLPIQVALQLIQPHHRPRRRRGRQRGDLSRAGRVHQPPIQQQRLERLGRAPGLADRGSADQQHEPAPFRCGRHPGPDAGPGGIGIARYVLRQDPAGYARHADRRVHAQPPQVSLTRPDRPGRPRHPRILSQALRRGQDAQRGQLAGDHGGELLRGPAAQVDRDHIRQQPGQRRVIEPRRQHILLPFPHRPVQRSPALEPGPVPGGVLSGHEHHHRRRLLAIDGRQLLRQVLPPQIDLLIGIVETAHPPRLQRTGDLLDVGSLSAGERQRHIPPPPRPGTQARAAVRSRHDPSLPPRLRKSPGPAAQGPGARMPRLSGISGHYL